MRFSLYIHKLTYNIKKNSNKQNNNNKKTREKNSYRKIIRKQKNAQKIRVFFHMKQECMKKNRNQELRSRNSSNWKKNIKLKNRKMIKK